MMSLGDVHLTLSELEMIISKTKLGIQMTFDDFSEMVEAKEDMELGKQDEFDLSYFLKMYKQFLSYKTRKINTKYTTFENIILNNSELLSVGLEHIKGYLNDEASINNMSLKLLIESYIKDSPYLQEYHMTHELFETFDEMLKIKKRSELNDKSCRIYQRAFEQIKMLELLMDEVDVTDVSRERSEKYLLNYLTVKISGDHDKILNSFISENNSLSKSIINEMLNTSINLQNEINPKYKTLSVLGLKAKEQEFLKTQGLDNFVSMVSKGVYCHVLKGSDGYVMDFYVLQDTDVRKLEECNVNDAILSFGNLNTYLVFPGCEIMYNENPLFQYDVVSGTKNVHPIS